MNQKFKISDIKVQKESWYLHHLTYNGKVIGSVEWKEYIDGWEGILGNSIFRTSKLNDLMNGLMDAVKDDDATMKSPSARAVLLSRGYSLPTSIRHIKKLL